MDTVFMWAAFLFIILFKIGAILFWPLVTGVSLVVLFRR